MKKFNLIFFAISFLLLSSCTPFSKDRNVERYSNLESIAPSNPLSTTNPLRIALLIGNQGYEKDRLDTPHNDVDDMATALEAVGFKVRKLKDQSLWEMKHAILGFGELLAQNKNTVGLFYFSGHGMQYRGENFLFPIKGMEFVTMPEHLALETLNAEYLLATMEGAENRLNLVFLDACRDNPFTKGFFKGKELEKGLAPMQAPSGSLIAYATRANHPASAGKGQRNSPYTQHLKQEILRPKISIFKMLTNVRLAVKKETHGSQEPSFYSELDGEFCFKAPCGQVEPVQPDSDRDDIAGTVFRDRLKDGSQGPEMVRISAGTLISPLVTSFRMGDIQGGGDGDEQPVHSVSVKKFAMGRYEVTFAKYDKFAQATGREKPNDKGWGRGNRPVINVSWNDATAYAEWLSEQTGQTYRLPTEAEWEYAARAGTGTARYWGNDPNEACDYANVGDKTAKEKLDWPWLEHNCTDGYVYTAPVGRFKANAFDLFDMLGNVWEWTCSEYEGSYKGKEKHCLSKNRAQNEGPFVLRGGSWDDGAGRARSAYRGRWSRTDRGGNRGFRLARLL
jgi:formylglycine-generating enzyme required for sulfatase activity